MKKFLSALVIATLSFTLVACGGGESRTPDPATTDPVTTDILTVDPVTTPDPATDDSDETFAIMVTDMGGVYDQSFNQSAWEGLEAFQNDKLGKVKYIESGTVTDITTNLAKATEENPKIVWGIGFLFNDAILEEAVINPDTNYAIVDSAYEETPDNVTGVMFKAYEPSFLVGYMAARTTKNGKVGFVGGMEGEIISQFDYGFKAGVQYANEQNGLFVEVLTQYVNDFADESKAKGIANSMYAEGADIVFHAAGQAGLGVIAAADESGNLAIGVDRDQSDISPNVMTSALKNVNKAVYDVSKMLKDGEDIGGKTFWFGFAEEGAGIPPYEGNTKEHVEKDVYDATVALIDLITSGEIVVPANETELASFKTGL